MIVGSVCVASRTIAFPSIATGIYRFPVEKAAGIAIGTVGKFVEENAGCIDMVEWVLFDENTEKVYLSGFTAPKEPALRQQLRSRPTMDCPVNAATA